MNNISRLHIGVMVVDDKAVLKDHVVDFFKDLYSNSGLCRPKLDGWNLSI